MPISRPRGWRLVLVSAAVLAALTGALVKADAWQRDALGVSVAGEVEMTMAHVGTVYSMGVTVWTMRSQPVQIVSARVLHLGPGLTQTDAQLGFNCDGKSHFIGAGVGADLTRSDAPYNLTSLSARRVAKSPEDYPCWFLLLRFIPTELGTHEARDGEVTYKVGFRTYRKRFAFRTQIDTTTTGPDPREMVVR